MNRESVVSPDPWRVQIPTWSSAEFKVPREHRRSCEMIGFRSVDRPNDSVEPRLLADLCVSLHMNFCISYIRKPPTIQESYFPNFSSNDLPNDRFDQRPPELLVGIAAAAPQTTRSDGKFRNTTRLL